MIDPQKIFKKIRAMARDLRAIWSLPWSEWGWEERLIASAEVLGGDTGEEE